MVSRVYLNFAWHGAADHAQCTIYFMLPVKKTGGGSPSDQHWGKMILKHLLGNLQLDYMLRILRDGVVLRRVACHGAAVQCNAKVYDFMYRSSAMETT